MEVSTAAETARQHGARCTNSGTKPCLDLARWRQALHKRYYARSAAPSPDALHAVLGVQAGVGRVGGKEQRLHAQCLFERAAAVCQKCGGGGIAATQQLLQAQLPAALQIECTEKIRDWKQMMSMMGNWSKILRKQDARTQVGINPAACLHQLATLLFHRPMPTAPPLLCPPHMPST